MSLRERLLSTVDSFFLAITSSGEINDAFSVDFGSLLNALEEARRTTSLSSEDGKLAFEVAKTIEELVGGIQQLDGVCMELGRELESRAEKELMAGECEDSRPQQSSSLSSSPSTTACSSPNSSTTTLSTRKRTSKLAVDPLSDLSPTTESSDSNTVFAPLRDWFLEHMAFPFPTKLEKKILVLQKGLTLNSINLWFTNMRRRSGWTEAQHTFASSNLNKMKSLVEQYNNPSSVSSSTPPLTDEFIKEVERLTTYVQDRGNGRVRDFVLKVLQDGIETTKNLPDDAFEDSDDSSEDEDDETRLDSEGGRTMEEEDAQEPVVDEQVSKVRFKRKGSRDREEAGERREKVGGGITRTIASLPPAEQTRRYSFESSSTDSSYTGSGPPTPTAYWDRYRKESFSSESTERFELVDSRSSCGSISPYPFYSQQPQYSPRLFKTSTPSDYPVLSIQDAYSSFNSPSPVANTYPLSALSRRRHSSTMIYHPPALDGYPQEDLSRRSTLPWSFKGGRGEDRPVDEGTVDSPRYPDRHEAPSNHVNSRPFVQAYFDPSSYPHTATPFHPSTPYAQETRPSSFHRPHLAGDPYPSYHHHQHQPSFHAPSQLPLHRQRTILQREPLRQSSATRRSSMSPLATSFSANDESLAQGSRKRRSSALPDFEGGSKRTRYGMGGGSEEGGGGRRVEWVSER